MSTTQICVCGHKYIRMLSLYLLTLYASTSIFTSVAEGRAIPTLTEAAQGQRGIMEEQGVVMMAKGEIGSRPPKCEGRCRNCGRCEAVQVPVVPQVLQRHSSSNSRTHSEATIRATPHSRGDDLSNYKPMSWKCKCGNYYFNP